MKRREFLAAMIAAPVATTIAAAEPTLQEKVSAAFDGHTMRPPGPNCIWWEDRGPVKCPPVILRGVEFQWTQ